MPPQSCLAELFTNVLLLRYRQFLFSLVQPQLTICSGVEERNVDTSGHVCNCLFFLFTSRFSGLPAGYHPTLFSTRFSLIIEISHAINKLALLVLRKKHSSGLKGGGYRFCTCNLFSSAFRREGMEEIRMDWVERMFFGLMAFEPAAGKCMMCIQWRN